jgi:hypothetical protein
MYRYKLIGPNCYLGWAYTSRAESYESIHQCLKVSQKDLPTLIFYQETANMREAHASC